MVFRKYISSFLWNKREYQIDFSLSTEKKALYTLDLLFKKKTIKEKVYKMEIGGISLMW